LRSPFPSCASGLGASSRAALLARAVAVKIGQQMAIRIDLVPYAYAFELSKLLDREVD